MSPLRRAHPRTVANVFRASLVLAVLAVTLAFAAASPAAASDRTVGANYATADSVIVLRGRKGIAGPWRRYLWVKLDRSRITSFTVCAARGLKSLSPSCTPRGGALPTGSVLRLEQRRAGRSWRTVAISREPALQAVLSNSVTGNRVGTTSYRVTLRNGAGRVVETSNMFRVYWTK
jgi:hypothetical protein